jgi:lipoprotein-releasing system permease protein
VRIFEVAGIFKTGMYEYDSSLAYVTIPAAQDLLGYKTDLISGLELKVTDIYAAGEIGDRVLEVVGGPPYYTMDWMDMNANLFAALKLEKTAMFIILIMIVLVGSFSIVTTLIMLVMEKTKDIAVLKAMGASHRMIRKIFIIKGLVIGMTGTLLGTLSGIGICVLLKRYDFIRLPQAYPFSTLPVQLDPLDVLAISVSAVVICFISTLYPSWKASNMDPLEAIRYG